MLESLGVATLSCEIVATRPSKTDGRIETKWLKMTPAGSAEIGRVATVSFEIVANRLSGSSPARSGSLRL